MADIREKHGSTCRGRQTAATITKCLAKHGYPLQISVPVWSYCCKRTRCIARCTDGRRGDGVHYQANYHISRAAVHLRSGYRDGGRDVTVLRGKYRGASLNARSSCRGFSRVAWETIVLFIGDLVTEACKQSSLAIIVYRDTLDLQNF